MNQRSFVPDFNKCVKVILENLSRPTFEPKFKISDDYHINQVNKILISFYHFGNKLNEENIIELLNNGITLDEILLKDFQPTEIFFQKCKNIGLCKSFCLCNNIEWLKILCKEYMLECKGTKKN